MSLINKLTRRQLNLANSNVNTTIQDEIESTSPTTENDLKLTRHYGLISLIFLCVSNSIGSGKYLLI